MMFKNLSLALLIIALSISSVNGNQRFTRSASCAEKFQQIPDHTACLSNSSDATAYELTSKEKLQLLKQHNEVRGSLDLEAANMLKMTWDDEIAMVAKKWTDSCKVLKNGKLNHDSNTQRFIPGRFSVGQNLASSFNTFEQAVKAWADEKEYYEYGLPYQQQTSEKAIGHYTQMVWAETYKLGCSKTKCGKAMVYACNYAPAGNLGNFKEPYKKGESMCKKSSQNLCDCGKLECVNGSPLDVSTCTCQCTAEYFLDQNCNFNCSFKDKSYCGRSSFNKEGCKKGPYVVSVSQKCPHMCDVCPYAEQGHEDAEQGHEDAEQGHEGKKNVTNAEQGHEGKKNVTNDEPGHEDKGSSNRPSIWLTCFPLICLPLFSMMVPLNFAFRSTTPY